MKTGELYEALALMEQASQMLRRLELGEGRPGADPEVVRYRALLRNRWTRVNELLVETEVEPGQEEY